MHLKQLPRQNYNNLIIEIMLSYKELLKEAYKKAIESTNPSTQNGALLVNDKGGILAQAANPFPDRIAETPERFKKELRYKYGVHAERNVIYNAAKLGIKTEGLTMVCPWAACTDCAQAIIQAGIKKLVVHKEALDLSGHWAEDIAFANKMLKEAEVRIEIFEGKIGAPKILRSGVYWTP